VEYKMVSTGSAETESQLHIFLRAAEHLDSGVPRKLFTDEYHWKVMTSGRNGEKDAYPGSQAKDDTGGFFEERDGLVYLTDKAKSCIRA
jgi:hypothetical protein